MEKPFWAAARRVPALWIEPDAYLRYQPVIKWIRKSGNNPQVLEIGSGDFGLASYLKYPVVRTDIRFKRRSPSASRVQSDAAKLPFKDKSFDLVFSADLLEHVPAAERAEIIGEAVRVSRQSVLMIFPCGAQSREQDLRLARKFEMGRGMEMAILKEHERFSFPEEQDPGAWLQPVSHRVARWQMGKSYNLKLRELLMSAWLGGYPGLVEAVMKWPFIHFLLHSGRCYRRVVMIDVG